MEPTTYCILAGSWVGAWSWHAVIADLESRGHQAVAIGLPGSEPGEAPRDITLADAVDTIEADINRRDLGQFTLVCHDVSGPPATAIANRLPDQVSHLIYWSAFVPEQGESIFDGLPPEDTEMLLKGAVIHGGHAVLAPYWRWQSSFVQPAPEPVQHLTYGLLRPLPITYMRDRLTPADVERPHVPITYLVGNQDDSLPRGEYWWAPKYSARAGVEPRYFDAVHAAQLLQPTAVADVLSRPSR